MPPIWTWEQSSPVIETLGELLEKLQAARRIAPGYAAQIDPIIGDVMRAIKVLCKRSTQEINL